MDLELSQSIFERLLNQVIQKLRAPTAEVNTSEKFHKTQFRTFSISENLMLTQQWLANIFSTQEQKRVLATKFFEMTDPKSTFMIAAGIYYDKVN